MDPKKTIGDYGVDHSNTTVYAVGIPDYMFGTDGIIKEMKINGEWAYNESMITTLKLQKFINNSKAKYGQKNGKAMTSAVV